MAKITPESIADLKALFQDNEKALGANFSQLIDFFNNNKVTDNGDGTFTVGTIVVDASKLYDLINNSSPNILPLDNEFTGKNTFDIAPINKANGKPYITEDSVPTVDLSNYPTKDQLATKADDSKVVHNSGDEEISGKKTFDVAPIDKTTSNPYITKSGVTTAISAATANMADTTKATNFTNGLQSGGVNVATAADIKSVKDSAWRQLDDKYIKSSNGMTSYGTYVLYRLDTLNKRLFFMFTISTEKGNTTVTIDFSSVVSNISTPNNFYNYFMPSNDRLSTITVSKNLLNISLSDDSSMACSIYSLGEDYDLCFVNYDKLV